jgi:hypothetical protein
LDRPVIEPTEQLRKLELIRLDELELTRFGGHP